MPAPATFTPAFANAFKNLTGSTPEELAVKHKSLKPEARLNDLKNIFNSVANAKFQASKEFIPKMGLFLVELNKVLKDDFLAQELVKIDKLVATNPDQAKQELQKLFQNEQRIAACAKYWDMYLKSQNAPKPFHKDEEMASLFTDNAKDAGKSLENIDRQGDYTPEKKVIRDLFRLLFELWDCVLVQSGHSPVFKPNPEEHGQGLRNPKTGEVRGHHGVHYPGQ